MIVGLFLAAALAFVPSVTWAQTMKICVDDDWFPYTFVQNGQAAGVHVDIVREAISRIGQGAEFIPLPWKRCLKMGEQGSADAILSASYKDNRAAFAHYPDDAKTAKKSAGRIGQVEQVLVTRRSDPYDFTGDWSTIPQPVGIFGLGSSVTVALKTSGLETVEGKSKINGLRMLMINRISAVTFNLVQAQHFIRTDEFKGKMKIHKVPLTSKSYHLIFSKRGSVSREVREATWSSLSATRSDQAFMFRLVDRYGIKD